MSEIPDRPVKKPAKALRVDAADLPELGRPWTKRDVHDLRAKRPAWLIEARRRRAARLTAAGHLAHEREARRLDAMLTQLGFIAPDRGSAEQAAVYVATAIAQLADTARCSEDAAEAAAWRRWPESMAALEDEAED